MPNAAAVNSFELKSFFDCPSREPTRAKTAEVAHWKRMFDSLHGFIVEGDKPLGPPDVLRAGSALDRNYEFLSNKLQKWALEQAAHFPKTLKFPLAHDFMPELEGVAPRIRWQRPGEACPPISYLFPTFKEDADATVLGALFWLYAIACTLPSENPQVNLDGSDPLSEDPSPYVIELELLVFNSNPGPWKIERRPFFRIDLQDHTPGGFQVIETDNAFENIHRPKVLEALAKIDYPFERAYEAFVARTATPADFPVRPDGLTCAYCSNSSCDFFPIFSNRSERQNLL